MNNAITVALLIVVPIALLIAVWLVVHSGRARDPRLQMPQQRTQSRPRTSTAPSSPSKPGATRASRSAGHVWVGNTAGANSEATVCAKGHPIDPSWTTCPRCEAELRARKRGQNRLEKTGGFRNENKPASSRSRPSIYASVDDALDQLELGNIAFNSPADVNIDESVRIELKLDLHTPSKVLARSISARGVVEFAQIKVANRMTAHLSGPDFDITPVTSETQAVSAREPTTWMWTIKPRTVGRFDLCLDLNANILVDGAAVARTLRTFSKSIHVTVRPAQRVTHFVKAHWQWLCVSVIVPTLGWWWKHRH